MPHIDTIRRSLSSFDIDSLNSMHEHIVKTVFRNKVFYEIKIQYHFDHCYVHSEVGAEAVVGFMIIAFNLSQLYFFRNIRGFREKNMLQIDIIEDIRDEVLLIKNWVNPIFDTT